MTFHSHILNDLLKIARDIQPVGGARIAAALVTKKGDIISYGVNTKKSHPFQARYSYKPEAIYFHAETLAIYNALKIQSDLSSFYLYIARTRHHFSGDKEWHPALVEPCLGCQRCILMHSIKDVYHT